MLRLLVCALLFAAAAAAAAINPPADSQHIAPVKSVADSQVLYGYDEFVDGDFVRVDGELTSLAQFGYDNRISFVCITGIWLLYSNDFWNDKSPGENWWGYGDSYCDFLPPEMDNQASSLRFVGGKDDWQYHNTIALFSLDFFNGIEQYYDQDVAQVGWDNVGLSLMVTGCSPWTIYEDADFKVFYNCFYILYFFKGIVSENKNYLWTILMHIWELSTHPLVDFKF
jgi:hypothetical protein